MPSHVFISYSRKDNNIARKLANDLKAIGYSIWLDTNEINGGEEWYENLEQAIKDSFLVIAILTPSSIRSSWCRKDWLFADRLGKLIVPLLVSGEIPYLFVDKQVIDLTDYNQGFFQLNKILEPFLDHRGTQYNVGTEPSDAGITKVFSDFNTDFVTSLMMEPSSELKIMSLDGGIVYNLEQLFVRGYYDKSQHSIPKLNILLPDPDASFISYYDGLSSIIRSNLSRLNNLESWPHMQNKVEVNLINIPLPFTMLANAEGLMLGVSTLNNSLNPHIYVNEQSSFYIRFAHQEFNNLWQQSISWHDKFQPSVFVFYQHQDRDFAEYVVYEMRKQGVKISSDIDLKIHRKSEGPWQKIENEIKRSDVLIVIIGENTTKSEWVKREIEFATKLNKPIIPVYRSDVETTEYSDAIFRSVLSKRGLRVLDINFLDVIIDELSEQVTQEFVTPNVDKILPSAMAVLDETDDVSDANNSEQTEIFDVFISYSHDDDEIMERVFTDFESQQIKCWTDRLLKPGTESWRDAIERAIENSKTLIVLMSPNSKESKWVKREIYYASVQEIPILPMLVLGSSKTSVPYHLIDSQWADCRSEFEDDYDGDKVYRTELDIISNIIVNLREGIQAEKSDPSD